MEDTARYDVLQRWQVVQHELIPGLESELGGLTPKLEKLIHMLEWVRLEEFVPSSWCGEGRPPHERSWLANAFIAKVVLGIDTTVGLIERLQVDRRLRRLCGFMRWQRLPSESTFSRAFAEFSASRLGERVHEVLVKNTLGDRLIGHLSRDSTAIESRERPVKTEKPEKAPVKTPKRRGRPRRGEVREPAKESKVQKQRRQTLPEMLADIPKACDRGTKQNAKGYKTSWNGYKLHIDTADCGVPVSVLLSSASMHDSLAAIPLSLISASRVTNCYDLMDAAYCCANLREHSRELGHVPLIDHNPRGGEKIEFAPHEARRYDERTAVERTNARLKDEFGAKNLRVKGAVKVMGHLMFGILALTVDQLMRCRW